MRFSAFWMRSALISSSVRRFSSSSPVLILGRSAFDQSQRLDDPGDDVLVLGVVLFEDAYLDGEVHVLAVVDPGDDAHGRANELLHLDLVDADVVAFVADLVLAVVVPAAAARRGPGLALYEVLVVLVRVADGDEPAVLTDLLLDDALLLALVGKADHPEARLVRHELLLLVDRAQVVVGEELVGDPGLVEADGTSLPVLGGLDLVAPAWVLVIGTVLLSGDRGRRTHDEHGDHQDPEPHVTHGGTPR